VSLIMKPIFFNRISVLLITYFALFYALSGHSAEFREITYGVYPAGPLFSEKDGIFSGLGIEMFERVVKTLGLSVRYVSCPLKRCRTMLEQGKLDALGFIIKTPDREAYFLFIEPPYYIRNPIGFYFATENDARKVQRYEDLVGLSIGCVIGELYFEPFDSDQNLNKKCVPRRSQLYKMLKSRRIETFLEYEWIFSEITKQIGYENEFELAPFRETKERKMYLVISKKSVFSKEVGAFAEANKEALSHYPPLQ